MIRNVKVISSSAFVAMFFLGVSAALVGAAANSIGLSPLEIGLLIAVQNLGFMIAVMISGALADRVEKPRLLFVGSVILALAYFTFYISDQLWINLIIMFCIGAGIGVYEGVTDAMLIDLHPRRQGYYININHFFVTFGTIMIAVYLTFLTVDWRNAVVQSAVIVVILALVFALSKLAVIPRPNDPYLNRLKILTKDRVLLALFGAIILIIGVETGTVGILTTFLSDARNVTDFSAQIGLILFSVGVAGGRLLVGYFTQDDQVAVIILVLLGLSTIVYSALYFIDLGTMIYIQILLAGLSISALIPLIITLAGQLYPLMAGTVLGAIKVAMPIGGIITPFLMSIISSRISFEASMALFPLSFALAFAILFPVLRGIQIPSEDALPYMVGYDLR